MGEEPLSERDVSHSPSFDSIEGAVTPVKSAAVCVGHRDTL